MKPRSAKAKGRRLQQEVATRVAQHFGLPERDVRPAVMGENGADLKLSEAAFKAFPFAVECKNVERLNVRSAFAQCEANAVKYGGYPIVISRSNNTEPLAILKFEDLLSLLKGKE